MENNLYLLSQILELSSADIKEIIDSEMDARKLNFSDRESLQKCFKLERAIISKVEALKRLISERSFGKSQKRKKIKSTEIAVEYLRPIFHMSPIEYLIVLFLNNGNAVVDQIKIRGSIGEVKMDYRFVLKRAVIFGATRIICAHNHPSGNVNPSDQDKKVTSELKKS
jgi:DNA repair protein RadC